jgi:hypothetical protein
MGENGRVLSVRGARPSIIIKDGNYITFYVNNDNYSFIRFSSLLLSSIKRFYKNIYI